MTLEPMNRLVVRNTRNPKDMWRPSLSRRLVDYVTDGNTEHGYGSSERNSIEDKIERQTIALATLVELLTAKGILSHDEALGLCHLDSTNYVIERDET